MVKDISEKDKEIKSMKVDFFNQQEALVRENNLLKNKLHTSSHGSTDPNRTSSDHFLARPQPSVNASRTGPELKDILKSDALIQDLHEQIMHIGKYFYF